MKFKKIKRAISVPLEKAVMTGRVTKMALRSDAKFRFAVGFANQTIKEVRRAVDEKTFSEEQKKLWKGDILKKYIGRKCVLYPYAKGLVKRIEKDSVESEDYEWMETKMIPLFESDMQLYEKKIGG